MQDSQFPVPFDTDLPDSTFPTVPCYSQLDIGLCELEVTNVGIKKVFTPNVLDVVMVLIQLQRSNK